MTGLLLALTLAVSPLEDAVVALSAGEPVEGIYDALSRSVGKPGPDAATARVLAGLAAELERWPEAEKWLAALKPAPGEERELAAQRAWVQRMGQLQAGSRLVYDAVRYDALQSAAAASIASSDLSDAVRLTTRAEAAGPGRHEHAALLGKVLLEAGHPREACPWLERASARAPEAQRPALGTAFAACTRAVRLLDDRRVAGAEGDLLTRGNAAYEAWQLRPDLLSGALEGALALWQAGDLPRARELIAAVVARGTPNEMRSAALLERAIAVDARLRQKMNAGAPAAPPGPAFGPAFDQAMGGTLKQIADSKAYAEQAARNSVAYEQSLVQKLKDLDAEISNINREIWSAEDAINSLRETMDELTSENARSGLLSEINRTNRELRDANTRFTSKVNERGHTKQLLDSMRYQR